MYSLLRILLAPLLLLVSYDARPAPIEDSLWTSYQKATKPVTKANILLALADQYDLKDNITARDSIFDIALEDVSIKTNDTLLVNLYNWYFTKEDGYFTGRIADYAKGLDDIARKQNSHRVYCYAYAANAKLNIYYYKFDDAFKSASKAYYYSTIVKDPALKVKMLILAGNCLEKSDKKIDAFKKYTDALYLSQQTENTQLIYISYQALSTFYDQIYNKEKAKEYTNGQLKILLAKRPIDSLELMELNFQLANYLFDNNDSKAGEKVATQIINYAIAHNYVRLKNRIFTSYRTFLINKSRFKELSDLYVTHYPTELNDISLSNPNLYLRLKALISEANGQMDSSLYFYERVTKSLQSESNSVLLSNIYKRYGEFLIRRGEIPQAEEKLKIAFKHAEAAQYVPYLTELSHELDSLSYAQGKTEEAYKYAKLNLSYNKQSELAQEEEKLLKLEVENEARERELLARQETEAIEERHNIQYMGISVVIVFSFIVLAMIGSFKVPKIVVKAIGFFSFIFFFEFIIMLADHKIHHITHGEPWQFMAFKIVLIGILLPLHHWLEEKVIHYLVSHKLVEPSKLSIKKWFGKHRTPVQARPALPSPPLTIIDQKDE